MAEYLSVPLSKIHVGPRARPIDEDMAAAIAANMAERGLINPVTLRRTPAANKGATPFTLIAGGHRHRGAQINEWEEIDAIIVEADAADAQLIELSENIYRNELSKLDRGIFVSKFREVYEEKHGKLIQGGDRKSKSNDWTLIFAPGRELSERVQERLGIGRSTYFNVTKIGQNLRPELRNQLRGTPAADDQSQLLKLAKMPSEDQVRIANALKEGADLKTVLSWSKPEKPEVDHQAALLKKLLAAWDDASDETRSEFLVHIGVDPLEGLGDLMADIKREAAA